MGLGQVVIPDLPFIRAMVVAILTVVIQSDELTIVAMSTTSEKAEVIDPDTIPIEFEIILYAPDKNVVRTGKSKDNKIYVNTKGLKKGIYFLHIIDREQVIKEQILVE